MAGQLRRLWQDGIAEWARRRAVARGNRGAVLLGGRFTLARIIGNDLFPRHADGQALRNLDWMLTAEPDLPGCVKLFVLNRLFDRPSAQAAAERIRAAGHQVIDLPFDAAAYAGAGLDLAAFGGLSHFTAPGFARRDAGQQARDRLWALRPRLEAAIGLNSARNLALAAGQTASDWTLVLDGGCSATAAAFATLSRDIASAPFAPYLLVPMRRLVQGDDPLTADPSPDWREEPQIAFHRSATCRFDDRLPYGLRDKTELFTRLGVPGPWQRWPDLPYLAPLSAPAAERHFYKRATASVLRLPSAAAGQGLDKRGFHDARVAARNAAVMRTLAWLDRRHAAPDARAALQVMGLTPDEVPE